MSRRQFILHLLCLGGVVLTSTRVLAQGPNPADFPGIPLRSLHTIQPAPPPPPTATPIATEADDGPPSSAPDPLRGAVVPPSAELPKTRLPGFLEGRAPLVSGSPALPQKPGAPAPDVPSLAELVALPGRNEIVPVSQHHFNRLLTPFAAPKVRTTNENAEIEVEGNVVYVAPRDKALVTMMITDGANAADAISLTLLPQSIPPRELRIRLDDKSRDGVLRRMTTGATEWEKNQEYPKAVISIFRAFAQQTIPDGYGLREYQASVDPPVECPGVDLTVEPMQVADGHRMFGVISRVTNLGTSEVEVIEGQCYAPNVLAVAVWPPWPVRPQESAELYVLFRRPAPSETVLKRPSLL